MLLLYWIKKQSSRGRLLEHLESSGTKMMMKCVGVNREANKLVMMTFTDVSDFSFGALPIYYLSEVFKARLVSFWS